MEKTVSAADANRNFSRLLRDVREGRSYVVTSHGKAVAKIVPAGGLDKTAAQARASLLARLKRERVVNVGRWAREELYEDER